MKRRRKKRKPGQGNVRTRWGVRYFIGNKIAKKLSNTNQGNEEQRMHRYKKLLKEGVQFISAPPGINIPLHKFFGVSRIPA